jgi:hypothetical protein
MKKLLLGSIAFFLFSISVSILQTSCDKDATADSNNINEVNQLNKILFQRRIKLSDGPPHFDEQIWMANYDGTGETKININLPAGYAIGSVHNIVSISPDGKKMFFQGYNTSSMINYIFSCDLDGNNVAKLIADDAYEMSLSGAF